MDTSSAAVSPAPVDAAQEAVPAASWSREEVLAKLAAAVNRATQSTSLAPATLDGLLAVRGVIDVSEASDDDEAITAAGTQMLATLDQALDEILAMRGREGGALQAVLGQRLDRIKALTQAAEDCPGRRPEAVKARLEQAVTTLEQREHEHQQLRARQEQDNLKRLQQIARQVETLAAADQMSLKAGDRALRDIKDALDKGSNPLANADFSVLYPVLNVKQINALERQFKSTLIERSKKKFRLTREGQLLYEYGKQISQTFVVENRGGAGTSLGMTMAAKAEPDGYTLLVNSASHVVVASTYPNLPFSVADDLVAITQLASIPFVIAANPRHKSVQDMIATGKKPGSEILYGTAGAGSSGHLFMELYRITGGFPATHVPFRGTPEGMTEVIAGRIDMYPAPAVNAIQLGKDGKINSLAVSSNKRLPLMPEVPTMAEAGVPGYEQTTWNGLLAPSRTPASVVRKLNSEVAALLNSGVARDRFNSLVNLSRKFLREIAH